MSIQHIAAVSRRMLLLLQGATAAKHIWISAAGQDDKMPEIREQPSLSADSCHMNKGPDSWRAREARASAQHTAFATTVLATARE